MKRICKESKNCQRKGKTHGGQNEIQYQHLETSRQCTILNNLLDCLQVKILQYKEYSKYKEERERECLICFIILKVPVIDQNRAGSHKLSLSLPCGRWGLSQLLQLSQLPFRGCISTKLQVRGVRP